MFRKSFVLFSALAVSFASAQANSQTTLTTILTTASPTPTSSTPNSICGSGSLGNGKCGWVSGSSTRSTYSILWSCFAVILLCTWKVIHVNICSEAEHTASWKQWPFYDKKLRKVKSMSIAVLAPELISTIAYHQWYGARAIRLVMESKGFPCSMALGFYILMGGLAIRTSSGTTLIHPRTYIALMQIDERHEIVAQLPCDQDIIDFNKTDSLTTALACLQSIWLVVQCIGRTIQGSAISELELSTCAFVLCSLVTYAFWWNKPYDVEHRTIINLLEAAEPQIAKILKDKIPDEKTDYDFDKVNPGEISAPNSEKLSYLLGLLGVLLSVVHLAAWNWIFPSNAELWLWRVSSLALLGPLLFISLIGVAEQCSGMHIRFHKESHTKGIVIFITGIYCIARITIIAQIFLCFRAMPESVYKGVAWAQFIPHLS